MTRAKRRPPQSSLLRLWPLARRVLRDSNAADAAVAHAVPARVGALVHRLPAEASKPLLRLQVQEAARGCAAYLFL